jgi:hypothetical protein
MVLNDLHDGPFSVATDTSNKGNIECWLLLFSYFSRSEGCKTGLKDFNGDGREKSDDITEQIRNKLAENKRAPSKIWFPTVLTMLQLTNGIHHSVFQQF